jgi:hypothetical protein
MMKKNTAPTIELSPNDYIRIIIGKPITAFVYTMPLPVLIYQLKKPFWRL